MFNEIKNKKNFSIDRLASLCHVADKGTIKAATGDNPSQASLYSRQIKELEEFLEIKLLDRDSTPKKLTAEANELVEISRNYLSAIENYVLKLKDLPVKISIAAGESVIQWLLMPHLLPVLKKEISETTIVMHNKRSKDIFSGLKSGEFDIGILKESTLKNDRSKTNSIKKYKPKNMSFEYKLFVPKKIASGLRNPLSVEDLSGLPFSILEGGTGDLRAQVEYAVKKKSRKLNTVIECTSLTQLLTLIRYGEVCGFLPAYVSETISKEKIKVFDVQGIKYKQDLCFAWNSKREVMVKDLEQTINVISRQFS